MPWLLGLLETLSSHSLLDRLIRSRLWIGIVAFALLGIVTLQLGLLKMTSGIGRSLERSAVLQRENAALSIENSELTSGERVESEAAGKLGMRLGSVSGLKALSSHARTDVGQAAAALQSAAATSAATSESSSSSSESTAQPAGSGETGESGGSEAGAGESSGSEAGASEAHSSEAAAGSAGEALPGSETSEASAHGEAGTSSEASAAPPAAEGEGGAGGGTAAPGG